MDGAILQGGLELDVDLKAMTMEQLILLQTHVEKAINKRVVYEKKRKIGTQSINARLNNGAKGTALVKKAKKLDGYEYYTSNPLFIQQLGKLKPVIRDIVSDYLFTSKTFADIATKNSMESSEIQRYFKRGMQQIINALS